TWHSRPESAGAIAKPATIEMAVQAATILRKISMTPPRLVTVDQSRLDPALDERSLSNWSVRWRRSSQPHKTAALLGDEASVHPAASARSNRPTARSVGPARLPAAA